MSCRPDRRRRSSSACLPHWSEQVALPRYTRYRGSGGSRNLMPVLRGCRHRARWRSPGASLTVSSLYVSKRSSAEASSSSVPTSTTYADAAAIRSCNPFVSGPPRFATSGVGSADRSIRRPTANHLTELFLNVYAARAETQTCNRPLPRHKPDTSFGFNELNKEV